MVAHMKQMRPDGAKAGSDSAKLTTDTKGAEFVPPSEMHLKGGDLKHVSGTPVGQSVSFHVEGKLTHHTNQPKNSATPWDQNSARVQITRMTPFAKTAIPGGSKPKPGADTFKGGAQ